MRKAGGMEALDHGEEGGGLGGSVVLGEGELEGRVEEVDDDGTTFIVREVGYGVEEGLDGGGGGGAWGCGVVEGGDQLANVGFRNVLLTKTPPAVWAVRGLRSEASIFWGAWDA